MKCRNKHREFYLRVAVSPRPKTPYLYIILVNYPRLLIAGTHSGVGKTTITTGLMAALKHKGYQVQGFKAGPDYIDPSHHTCVTGMPSRNLDTWLMTKDVILELFERSAARADISIIEGVMGLYDGLGGDSEQGSSAHLAKILNAPVLLVIDARALARSAAALVMGFQKFDPDIKLCGVIANNIASPGHFEYVRTAIETYTSVPVVGYVPRDPAISIQERHLGLVPYAEGKVETERYYKLRDYVLTYVDCEQILRLMEGHPLPRFQKTLFTATGNRPGPINQGRGPTIGVAMDEAFNFYYADNLDILEYLGARLVKFSPIHDAHLPKEVNVLYFGGGFPEVFAEELAANKTLIREIRDFVNDMNPVYAECGGLMYLGESIQTFDGAVFDMVGVLPIRTTMMNKRMALGYTRAKVLRDTFLCPKGGEIIGHEFHWSTLSESREVTYAYETFKRIGGPKKYDGILFKKVLASYLHVHFASNIEIARRFIREVVSG